eukprot:TRINITY_DN9437_c0_g3_i1.p1 TRINITY_DN9437_c0_g3~~TRINITY_DN9437_c0_g3_i1.p1  ORF type:complete len:282 (-),score=39.65 TRINITY_DN9437_c0_g3_i1:46-891(-)
MHQKYQAFLQYSFNTDDRYRQYLDGIYPQPTPQNILAYRRKFYKKFVDPEFDASYKPPESKPDYDNSWVMNVKMMLLMFFCSTLPVCVLIRVHYHSIILALALLIGLFKRHGFFKCYKEYWIPVLFDDDFNDLVALCITCFSFFSTVILWVPLFVVALCSVAERVNQMTLRGNKAAWILNLPMHFLYDRREAIKTFKDDLEIYIGFYLILEVYLGWVPLLFPIFYWEVMQVRYFLNKRTYKSFTKFGRQIDNLIESPNCFAPFKWLPVSYTHLTLPTTPYV